MSGLSDLYAVDEDTPTAAINWASRLAFRLVLDAADACGIRLHGISVIGGLTPDTPVAVSVCSHAGTGFDRLDTKALALAFLRRLPGNPAVTMVSGSPGMPDTVCIRVDKDAAAAVLDITIRTDPATSATLVLAIEAAR